MMKKVVILLLCVMALMSCHFHVSGSNLIEPSDNIVTKEYQMSPFKAIVSHVFTTVEIIQSDEKDGLVVLTAPENYIELIKFNDKDERLNIGYNKDNINIDGHHVNITIYTSNLQIIKNSGAASISLDSLDTDKLDIQNSGVGSFRLNNVLADQVTVGCSGVGDISINGETIDATLNCSGVGSIRAKDLKSKNVDAHVSGVGGIECHASDYIYGRVTGVGSLKYAGHPTKKDVNKSITGGISEF